MDSVLWFIYFAGVAETLKTIAAMLLIGGAAVMTSWVVIHYIERDEILPFWKHFVVLFSICAVVVVFTPSSKLLYSIAGLRAGEVALQTEEGQKAMKLLNKKLDEFLKEEE